MFGDQLGPGLGVAFGLGVHAHQRATTGQWGEDVVHRQIEFQRGQAEHAFLVAQVEMGGQGIDGVGRGPVADLDSLGLTGGSGGEQHIGRRIGGDTARGVEFRTRQRGGQRDAGDPVGQFGRGVDQGDAGTGARQDTVAPGRRLTGPDRYIGGAGGEHTEHGGNLAVPLADHDRDGVTGPHSGVGERSAHGQGLAGQFAVAASRSAAPPQCRTLRILLCEREERVVQRALSEIDRGVVDARADLTLRGRQRDGQRCMPVRFVVDERQQQGAELVEHRLDDTGGQGVTAHVPVHQQAPGKFGHLRVQVDLRTLRQHPHGLTEQAGHAVGEQFSEVQAGGEDHRRGDRRTAQPPQIAEDVEPLVGGMRSTGVQFTL